MCTYQVAVTGLQSFINSLTNLTRGRLPGTESQLAKYGVSNKLPLIAEYTYGIW